MSSDYDVRWELNGYSLPFISKQFAEYLIGSGKCDAANCPNSFTHRKGKDPSQGLVAIPYYQLSTIIPDADQGDHTLSMVLRRQSEAAIGGIPELDGSDKLEFKKLYVTRIIETDKYDPALGADDLVLVELSDIRYFFKNKQTYNSNNIIPSGAVNETVIEQMWTDLFSTMYGGQTLTTTDLFYPESDAGVTNFMRQLSVDEYEDDWTVFNEACNRTENIFFIDYDGTPVVQKNSKTVASPIINPQEGDKTLEFYLTESDSSFSLGGNAYNQKYDSWQTLKGYFWKEIQKTEFGFAEVNPFDSDAITGSELSIFPLSFPANPGGLSDLVRIANWGAIVTAYSTEIQASVDIDSFFAAYNGIFKFDLKSQVSNVVYTNNPFGTRTLCTVAFRHGVPFYEFNGKLDPPETPMMGADFKGEVAGTGLVAPSVLNSGRASLFRRWTNNRSIFNLAGQTFQLRKTGYYNVLVDLEAVYLLSPELLLGQRAIYTARGELQSSTGGTIIVGQGMGGAEPAIHYTAGQGVKIQVFDYSNIVGNGIVDEVHIQLVPLPTSGLAGDIDLNNKIFPNMAVTKFDNQQCEVAVWDGGANSSGSDYFRYNLTIYYRPHTTHIASASTETLTVSLERNQSTIHQVKERLETHVFTGKHAIGEDGIVWGGVSDEYSGTDTEWDCFSDVYGDTQVVDPTNSGSIDWPESCRRVWPFSDGVLCRQNISFQHCLFNPSPNQNLSLRFDLQSLLNTSGSTDSQSSLSYSDRCRINGKISVLHVGNQDEVEADF